MEYINFIVGLMIIIALGFITSKIYDLCLMRTKYATNLLTEGNLPRWVILKLAHYRYRTGTSSLMSLLHFHLKQVKLLENWPLVQQELLPQLFKLQMLKLIARVESNFLAIDGLYALQFFWRFQRASIALDLDLTEEGQRAHHLMLDILYDHFAPYLKNVKSAQTYVDFLEAVSHKGSPGMAYFEEKLRTNEHYQSLLKNEGQAGIAGGEIVPAFS